MVLQKVRKQGIKFCHDSPKSKETRNKILAQVNTKDSLVFTCARILFLVSLLFVALLDPFDPYSPFKFLILY